MILMRRDILGRYDVRIKQNNVEDTYALAGALLSCLEWLDKECGLLLAHGAIVSGLDPATEPGPMSVEPTATGASITLTEGGKAGDLFDTLVTALQTGTIGKHWIVTMSNDGTLITFTDPDTIAPWADRMKMQPDYPSRLTPES